MSTKSSLFLTKDNEHWYYDFIDESITIEISRKNIQADFSDDHDLVIEIKPDCELWKYLAEFRCHTFETERKD